MTYLIIHLTGADVVAARFSAKRKSLAFLQGVRRTLSESGGYRELLSGLDHSDGGEKVILSIPPALVHSRLLSLPITDRRNLREILPLELAGEMAVQSEEMAFDGLPLGGDSLLAAWCRTSGVASLIEELAVAGIEPEIVTCSALHWNYLLPAGTEAPSAVTDGNALMIGTTAGPQLVRALPAGHGEREFARTISAFELSRNETVAAIVRIGAASKPGDIPAAEIMDAFGNDTAAAGDIAGAYAVAKACVEGTVVNFRSGSLAYTAGQEKNLRRLRLTAILAAVLLLLIFSETGLRYFLVRRDIASLDASIGAIYREIFPARQKPRDAVGEVRSEIKRLSGTGSSQRVLPILRKLAELKGDDVSGFYETEIEGANIRLKGDAKSGNDFKSRAAKVLATAEISEIKSKSDGSVSFVFRGSVKEGN
ncbi:gspL periplasmic domain protein [Geobacter sp. OR-1]|uniref:type II secretion system protein GspL n=1 Tax=Geobacter sp. OR-1 TaxID=1266765 RepID=UPI000541D1FD|nr:type II secretion system protein GspL [Geobacter sp. OR-1]GAM08759.1 gspL periplasmic domain protein [Geobacter sp. OR-1]